MLEKKRKKNRRIIKNVSSRLMDDIDFVKVALELGANCLPYVSERLNDDKEIVLLAVKKNGRFLQHASDRLKDDWDIVTCRPRDRDPSLPVPKPQVSATNVIPGSTSSVGAPPLRELSGSQTDQIRRH
jgi:hypothetical protein